MALAEREVWGDVAKGVGIVLVVSAHVLAAGGGHKLIVSAIYLFHMPLFFVVSGYFFKSYAIGDNFWRRLRGLIVPYIFLTALIFVLDALISALLNLRPSLWGLRGLQTILLGGSYTTGKYGVLWFLPCLFVVTNAYNAIASRSRGPYNGAVLVCMAAALVATYATSMAFSNVHTALGLADVPAGLVAFWYGNLLANSRPRRLQILSGATLIVLASGLSAWMAGVRFSFDMKHLNFGPPLTGLALALAISTIFIWLCEVYSQLLPSRLVATLGRNSLVIMMLHQLVHLTVRSLKVDDQWLIIAASITLPLLISLSLERWSITRRIFLGRP